jgi:hypothetical protein
MSTVSTAGLKRCTLHSEGEGAALAQPGALAATQRRIIIEANKYIPRIDFSG